MPLPQTFFEIRNVRPIDGSSWIPLRQVTEIESDAQNPDILSLQEWVGIGTAAVESAYIAAAGKCGWSNGLGVDPHRVAVENWGYSSADLFRSWKKPMGINLVIDQFVEQERFSVWHLHPDLIVALDLIRDGDCWFRPGEGWAEVVRLKSDDAGSPRLIEIRAEYLRDYLCARGMALYCSSYRERTMISKTKPSFTWNNDIFSEETGSDRLEGIIDDAANFGEPGHFWTRGALWRTEWVSPGKLSTRVRHDRDPHTSTFALERDGSRVPASQLAGSMSYLYFEPALATPLMRHKSANLRWFSQETGMLGATNYGVHFGVNELGLITVFAKDIGNLQPWEQRLWSAHNVTPDGSVSKELFAAQMEVNPAATVAPEANLSSALSNLDAAFSNKHGGSLLRDHESVPALLKRAHRFEAADVDGLLSLSKELTRLFAERIDVSSIFQALALAKADSKMASLKALEKLVAHHRTEAEASAMMAPLFGIYDLRLADAHLGSSKIDSAKQRIGIDDSQPKTMQGRQLLESFVDTLRQITDALK